MWIHELGKVLTGEIKLVPDGKIDTSHFAYPVESITSSKERISHFTAYGIDYTYRELYQPIEDHMDLAWIDLFENWLHMDIIARGYRKNR